MTRSDIEYKLYEVLNREFPDGWSTQTVQHYLMDEWNYHLLINHINDHFGKKFVVFLERDRFSLSKFVNNVHMQWHNCKDLTSCDPNDTIELFGI